jgi:hypothetical protein
MAIFGTTLIVSAIIKQSFSGILRVLLRFGKTRPLVMNSTFSLLKAGVYINSSDAVLTFRLTVAEYELNWLLNLEDNVVGGCGTTEGSCNPLGSMNCEEQFNKYGTDKDGNEHILGKSSYWIFLAAKGMQAKFRMLKEKLTSDTMVAGFLIPSMVKDLEGKEDQKSDIMKWLAAQLVLAEA